jgi:hypothetical protein
VPSSASTSPLQHLSPNSLYVSQMRFAGDAGLTNYYSLHEPHLDETLDAFRDVLGQFRERDRTRGSLKISSGHLRGPRVVAAPLDTW